MKKWKVAIVGAGYMAQEHAKALASIDSVALVGVCGRRHERADALANTYGMPVYESISEMFADTQADAVVVRPGGETSTLETQFFPITRATVLRMSGMQASEEEIKRNPRSRSVRLRAAVKI